ncbi:MAG: tetratricopeptide repeat protein [Verrucomicrobiota bacterium]|nr:tetratricopeptide repeat protein [Verrucomicrobiota bacterium]
MPNPINRIIKFASVAIIASFLSAVAHSEDVITRKSGEVVSGKITQVFPDAVMMKYKDAKSGQELSLKFFYKDMNSLVLDIPPTYDDAMKQFASGKYQQAITILEPLIIQYKGVIDPKIGTAIITVADAYVALNNLAKAEPLYIEFAKIYPDQASRANVGLAKIAYGKGETDKVMMLLASFEKEAAAVQSPTRAQERAFCEAFYILGQAYEKKKDYSKALECYLKSAVIYNGYQEIASQAQAKADALKKAKNTPKQTPVVFVP